MVIKRYKNKNNKKVMKTSVIDKGGTSMINPTIQELQARLKANMNKAVIFAEKNTTRNLAGQVVIGAEDEWRVTNEWNNDYDKQSN
jgi:hypothetical protein